MTNIENFIININSYCNENNAMLIQGSKNIFINELTEQENRILLKEMSYSKLIEYDDFQCKVIQLSKCKYYFNNKKKEWFNKWLPHIYAYILSSIALIISLIALLTK